MSAFSRRHYETIAGVIRESLTEQTHALFTACEASTMVDSYVRVFKHDNPNFNPETFRKACGVSVSRRSPVNPSTL